MNDVRHAWWSWVQTNKINTVWGDKTFSSRLWSHRYCMCRSQSQGKFSKVGIEFPGGRSCITWSLHYLQTLRKGTHNMIECLNEENYCQHGNINSGGATGSWGEGFSNRIPPCPPPPHAPSGSGTILNRAFTYIIVLIFDSPPPPPQKKIYPFPSQLSSHRLLRLVNHGQ